MQHELLVVYSPQLLEKEHSGCRALLRDDKVLLSESCARQYSFLCFCFGNVTFFGFLFSFYFVISLMLYLFCLPCC